MTQKSFLCDVRYRARYKKFANGLQPRLCIQIAEMFAKIYKRLEFVLISVIYDHEHSIIKCPRTVLDAAINNFVTKLLKAINM